jgi:hypothetical protein
VKACLLLLLVDGSYEAVDAVVRRLEAVGRGDNAKGLLLDGL